MFHKAVELEFMDGTALAVVFQDGAVMKYDMSTLFDKHPQLRALEDRQLFLSGMLMGAYGICWTDDLDIEVETIYEDGETIRTEKMLIQNAFRFKLVAFHRPGAGNVLHIRLDAL